MAACQPAGEEDRGSQLGAHRSYFVRTLDSRAGTRVQTSLSEMRNHPHLARGDWFAVQEVARLEREVVPMSFRSFPGVRDVRRLNSLVLFATHIGVLDIMPGNEGPENHSENEFLQVLPPLSSSTSGTSGMASSLRADRVGEEAHPGPMLSQFSPGYGTSSSQKVGPGI